MKFGIEALDTVKDLARQLVVVLRQIVNRQESTETKISELDTSLSEFNDKITELGSEFETLQGSQSDLQVKQNIEKRISCIATQRTFNTGGTYQEMSASDDSTAVVSVDNRRRLNHFVTNSSDYFEIVDSGLATNFIRIKKAGRYKVTFTSVCMRTGTATYCYVNMYNPATTLSNRFDRPAAASVATAATAVGNALVCGGSFEYEVMSGATSEAALWHFFNTRTVGFNYGRFGLHAGSYTDTCSLEIELITE